MSDEHDVTLVQSLFSQEQCKYVFGAIDQRHARVPPFRLRRVVANRPYFEVAMVRRQPAGPRIRGVTICEPSTLKVSTDAMHKNDMRCYVLSARPTVQEVQPELTRPGYV